MVRLPTKQKRRDIPEVTRGVNDKGHIKLIVCRKSGFKLLVPKSLLSYFRRSYPDINLERGCISIHLRDDTQKHSKT